MFSTRSLYWIYMFWSFIMKTFTFYPQSFTYLLHIELFSCLVHTGPVIVPRSLNPPLTAYVHLYQSHTIKQFTAQLSLLGFLWQIYWLVANSIKLAIACKLLAICFCDFMLFVQASYSPTILEFKSRLELKASNFHHTISLKVIEV